MTTDSVGALPAVEAVECVPCGDRSCLSCYAPVMCEACGTPIDTTGQCRCSA